METTELEAQVYDALTNNAELMGMLPSGGDFFSWSKIINFVLQLSIKRTEGIPNQRTIYHLFAPAGDIQRYPILVYSPISDVPVNYGDDEETFHRVTIRISIITNDGQYSEINKVIREIMTQQLEFVRVQTVPAIDFEYKKIILNAEYQTVIPA